MTLINMMISELFYSIQGEGSLTGMPSVFVRTSGCNLRCNWCDTPYASWEPEGTEMTIDEIVAKVLGYPTRYCVLTGGEPMIANGIHELADKLSKAGKHITIETAGTIAPDDIACNLASLSPKLSNSTPDDRLSEKWRQRHERDRLQPEIVRAWIESYEYQLKFVVTSENDIEEIDDLIKAVKSPITSDKVHLMPEGTTTESLQARTEFVVKLCKQFGYRYCTRLHIDLFGNKKGT